MPELHTSKDSLKALLDRTASAVAPSGAHPALQCFHVSIKPSAVTITASDQANTLVVSEDGEFSDSFEFLAPARLHAIVRQASPGIIQLSVSNNVLTVVSGSTSWDIKIPAVSYPKMVKPVRPEVELPAGVLRAAIKATRKAMAESALRPSLRMLAIRKGAMTACDGSRLCQFYLGDDFPRDFESFIPFNSVPLVWDMIKDDSQGMVGLSTIESHHVIQLRNVALLAKKLSSAFPNVEQLMLRPALENKQELRVDRSELIKAIDRVRINADLETDAVGLSLSAKSVSVAAKDKDGNSSLEVIPSNWMGKDRVLVVNHKYLIALVRGISSEDCSFFLGEDTKSRKSVILLKDEEKEFYGLIPQFSGNIRIF